MCRCRNADNNQNRSWSPIFSQGGQRPSNRPHFLQTAICEAQRRVSSHHVPTFKNWFKMQSVPLCDMEVDVPPIKLCPNAPDFALYEFGMVTSTVPVFTAVQCTRPLCDWAGLRLWNGHKVTISPSVGDSDGSIRRLPKSKNGAKTRTNIYWRSDTNFYYSFHCIFLKTL